MSTDTSVPQPRIPGLDASDSALFATLIKESPMGFAFFDAELRCRRVNDTLAELLGVAVEDLVDGTLSDALPDELAAAMAEHLAEVVRTDRAVTDKDLRFEPPAWPKDSWERSSAGREPVLVDQLVPLAQRRGRDHRDRPDRGGRHRATPRRGADPAQGGAVPLAGRGQLPDRLGHHARGRGQRRRAGVAGHHRPVAGGVPGRRVAGGRPRGGPGQGRGRVAPVPGRRPHLLDQLPGAYPARAPSASTRSAPCRSSAAPGSWSGSARTPTSPAQREADEMRGRLTEQLSAAALRTARLQQATSMLAEALTVGQVVSVDHRGRPVGDRRGPLVGCAARRRQAQAHRDRSRLRPGNRTAAHLRRERLDRDVAGGP